MLVLARAGLGKRHCTLECESGLHLDMYVAIPSSGCQLLPTPTCDNPAAPAGKWPLNRR